MKTKNMLVTGLCLAAIALGASPDASARGKKIPSPEPSAAASPAEKEGGTKMARAIPYHGKIASVDSSAKTFTIATKAGATRVFKMTDETKYMKDGAAATMQDVTADAMVRGQYWKKADGTMEAKSVMLGMKSASEKAPAHKKKMGDTEEASPAPSATP